MYFHKFLFLQLVVTSIASSIDLIHDYFVFKNATRVAGFSCGDIPRNGEIVRILNNAGIVATMKMLTSNPDAGKFLHTSYWNLGVILDLECTFADEDIIKLFNETSIHHMFDHLHKWLILGNISRLVPLINDEVFSIITDFVIAVPRNGNYILYDMYNHCKHCGSSLNITRFGTWTRNNGFEFILPLNKFHRRWNYHTMKIKTAGIIAERPKNQAIKEYLREMDTFLIDNWAKFGYAIMVHIADMFNFTYELIELNHWAKNDTNGPLMAGLHAGLYDLGYYPSILTIERLGLADVTVQMWPVRPFAWNVWYMICFLAIVIIFAFWAILKVNKEAADSDYGATVLTIIAALCQQGLPFFGNKFSSRIVFLQTMIFGLLVYNCYSAAIVSSRLNAPLNKMNDSLYTLLKSGFKLAANRDIYFNILLNSPAKEVRYFKRYWDTIPEEKKFYTLEQGIRSITKPGFAYHADPANAYPYIERIFNKQMICQLTEVHLLRPASLGFWSTRHSQLREIVKIGLIRILTSGIRDREKVRWSYRKPYCNKDKHYVSSVTLDEVIPVILILSIGIILSAFICLMEIIVFRVLQLRSKKMAKSKNAWGIYGRQKWRVENKAVIKANHFSSNRRL